MSRSNPIDTRPNPAGRWFEWDGAEGGLYYYDKNAVDPKAKKDAKPGMQVAVKDGFTFLVLDELSCIKGYSKQVGGIYSNEVRDSRAEVMVVKAFKGGIMASGLYSEIKDWVTSKAVGGHFTSSIYIAFKAGPQLAIGGLQLKGAALNTWIEFKKEHRRGVKHQQGLVYEKAVQIKGCEMKENGGIKFAVPKFFLKETTPETDAQAKALDVELADYLKGYFTRTKTAAAQPPQPGEVTQPDGNYDGSQEPQPGEPSPAEPPPQEPEPEPMDEDSDVPF